MTPTERKWGEDKIADLLANLTYLSHVIQHETRLRRTIMKKISALPVWLTPLCAFVFLFFATPMDAWAAERPRSFVLVADPIEERGFFYSVPELQLLGELPVALGSAAGSPPHAGTIGLPDGRILMASERTQEIIAVRIDKAGEPVIDAQVPATLGDTGPWSAVDRKFRYFALGSGIEGSDTQVVNLVDLHTFENTQAEIELTGEGELHPYLVGDPLTLVLADGATMRSFAVSDLLDGPPYTPSSTVGVGQGGHGPVFSPKTGRVALTTSAGLDVVDIVCPQKRSQLSCVLGERVTVPWDIDGRAGGQNFRPRLLNDGRTEMGAIGVAPADPLAWPDTDQDIHVVDMKTRTAQRFDMGNGVAARFASSNRFAVFSLVHPDGDRLRLLDIKPSSGSYLEFVGDAPLTALTNGPVAGQPLAGKERRFVGATPDGRFAFVTHGGDGIVSMVDTATLQVTEFSVPTALSGGGYVVGLRRGFKPVDLMGR